jgi:N-methylhydantoinase B
MFDRVRHPARGRNGGAKGAATKVAREDGTELPGKGRSRVPEGGRVLLAFPGGGGYGDPANRDRAAVIRDLRLGYVSEEAARRDYGLTDAELEEARQD